MDGLGGWHGAVEPARKPSNSVAVAVAGARIGSSERAMVVPAKMRQRVKSFLRPVLSPLLWRLRLPFDVMLPRIEHLERRSSSLPNSDLRETVDNLTRTWL